MPLSHAVVIGASVAGICAARVLRDRFDKVTLLDRDALPEGPASRAGAPQARHVHVLLQRGWVELERLFPGFQSRMREAGVPMFDPAQRSAMRRRWGWQRRMESGVVQVLPSRDRLESILRDLLFGLPGVVVRDRVEVTGLLTAKSSSGARGDNDNEGQAAPRVTGVRVHARGGGGATEDIEADFVIDASGRTSKAPDWLRAIGAGVPDDSVVDSGAGYSSRWYKMPDPSRRPSSFWWEAAWVDPAPPEHSLGGVLFPVEGGRWVATLFGQSKHYPPSDEADFNNAIWSLASPIIGESLALAEPLSPVYSMRGLSNRFRRYERLAAPVDGFIAMGDSVCVFNPVYGQGMTVTSLCAGTLESMLRRADPSAPGFARAFFDEQARVLAGPWLLATGADFMYPGTVGEKPPGTELIKHFSNMMTALSLVDEGITRTAWPIFHMLRPDADLRSPAFMARVSLLWVADALPRMIRMRSIPAMPPM